MYLTNRKKRRGQNDQDDERTRPLKPVEDLAQTVDVPQNVTADQPRRHRERIAIRVGITLGREQPLITGYFRHDTVRDQSSG